MSRAKVYLSGLLVAVVAGSAWLLLSDPKGGEGEGRGMSAITVRAVPAEKRQFADIVEAIGTARSKESVVLMSRVSETVSKVLFDDGQLVKEGQLLVKLTDDEEKAAIEEAGAYLREAQQQYERVTDLVRRGNASTATLDNAKRQLDEAQARLDGAKARLNDRRIEAPFDGILGLRQVSEGSLITTTTPITTIDQINVMRVDFSVPERFIAALKPGQSVDARVEAYRGETFSGKVTTVNSRVDPISRTIIVRAELDNKDLRLRPGMLMSVELTSRTWDGIAVPEEAVVPTAGKDYVFVVENGISNRKEVTLGLRRPGYVEITSGLEEGALVVTEGTLRLGNADVPVRLLGQSTGAEAGSNTVEAAQ